MRIAPLESDPRAGSNGARFDVIGGGSQLGRNPVSSNLYLILGYNSASSCPILTEIAPLESCRQAGSNGARFAVIGAVSQTGRNPVSPNLNFILHYSSAGSCPILTEIAPLESRRLAGSNDSRFVVIGGGSQPGRNPVSHNLNFIPQYSSAIFRPILTRIAPLESR